MKQISVNKSQAISLVIFAMAILIDQVTKNLSSSLFQITENSGIIFGLYSNAPYFIRVSVVSSFFGIIFFIYLLFLYFLPEKTTGLKYSLSLFIGGAAGNVWSKVFYGKTIDFIPLFSESIFFNVADLLQWIGAGFLVYHLIKGDNVWFDENKRGSYLIRPKEQINLCLKLVLVSICTSLLLGIFCYSFLRILFIQLNINNLDQTLNLFILAFSFLSIFFACVVFVAGILLSLQYSGPVYAFERYISELIEGKKPFFKLRAGDNHKSLEQTAHKILNYINSK